VADIRLDFVSKEVVAAELLSARLARGPVPAGEALRYAIEIGAALHKIHSRGLAHGALSPDCIALADGGARILEGTQSPEEHAAYRAPEQLRGEEPDARSDVFAYGALVYEIACGYRAFPGTGAELNQNILTRPTAPLPARSAISAALDSVIAGCLEKDPARRRQRVQNAVIELKLAGHFPSHAAEAPRRETPRPVAADMAPRPKAPPHWAPGGNAISALSFNRRAGVILGGILALAASSVAAVLFLQQKPVPMALKFAVSQPENTTYPGMPSVSPDGRSLTFSAIGPEGKRMLWLRPLDALHATVIQGTEGASAPFWSPDSQAIAFFSGKSLKKVRLAGGAPEDICETEASPGGGSWNRDGVILFAPSFSGGLYRVAASGGKPQPVLGLNESKSERADLWPQFLPDGKHFVFYQQTDLAETSGVYAGSLQQAEYRRLFTSQTNAVYSAVSPDSPKSGYLLYINERTLMAQQFNAGRLETAEDPVALANDIGAVRSLALAPISVSTTGVLVYESVGQSTRQMVWMDRGGRQIATAGEPGAWGPPRISPDGRRAVVAKTGADGLTAHLWLLDTDGGAQQISDGPMHEGSPVWSPDGSRIAYFGKQGDYYDIFTRAAQAGAKGELLLKTSDKKFPSDWSRDGRNIIFSMEGVGTRLDIWGLSMADRHPAPVVNTVYAEGFATLSPDGRWIAYQSDQSGRNEVYVQTFDGLQNGTRRRWMVSKGGGLPHWRADSSELFYMTTDGRVMSVAVRLTGGGNMEPGQPQMLFQTRPVPQSWNLYDVAPDGQHFAVNVPLEWTAAAPITVATSWAEKIKWITAALP
jgi:eukaryotic-like serine/threonine-protein kinase